MLTDPQSVTINAVAVPMARIRQEPTQNTYSSADGNTTMVVKQNVTTNRFRREVRLSVQKISAVPISALNTSKGFSVYLVVDEPRTGFSDTEIGYVIDALRNATGTAFYTRLLAGEM